MLSIELLGLPQGNSVVSHEDRGLTIHAENKAARLAARKLRGI